MHSFRRLLPFPHLSFWPLLAFLLCVASFSAQAQAAKKRPTPTPKASASSGSELTPDKLGAATPAASSPAASPSSIILPDVVATVNGESIKKDELERVFTSLLSANGRNLSELNDQDRKRGYRSVLEEMVTDRLVSKESANQPVPDADIDKRLDTLKASFPSPGAFDEELRKTGQSVDQVKANIRSQLQQQLWIESKIADSVKVTPEEVDKFYKENPDRFNLPEMVRASHILLAVRRDAPPEVALEKEKQIDDLAARIKKGESFAELAKQYSDDPNAKQSEGDLDYFSRDRIMPEFADAAFKLKVGEVSAPVRTQFGFHLIKVTDHKDPRTATLEEARPQINAYLQEAKRREAVTKLLASLRDNAKIEIKIP